MNQTMPQCPTSNVTFTVKFIIVIIFSFFVIVFMLVILQPLYQVTRTLEYQGVDAHFDDIARQYKDIVQVIIFFFFLISLAICRGDISLAKLYTSSIILKKQIYPSISIQFSQVFLMSGRSTYQDINFITYLSY